MKLSEALEKGFATQKNNNVQVIKEITELIVDISISGSLDCDKNQLTSLIIKAPIGGWLYCRNNQLTTLEINQPIGDSLNCRNNQLTSLEINQPIGGWLNCSYNQLTSLEINQPIGDSLACNNNQLTTLEINHPIGGSLYCDKNQLTTLEIKAPIGGWLDCSCNLLESKPKYEQLKEGDSGKNWVYLDGILTVFKHKRTYKEFTVYTSVFDNSGKYAVTNGTHSAHARTIKQAIIDIRFKEQDRNVDDYRDLTLDSKLSYEDAIVMYRAITGACSGGTEQFLSQHPELSSRKKYSVQEILGLTEGQYGHDTISGFFNESKK